MCATDSPAKPFKGLRTTRVTLLTRVSICLLSSVRIHICDIYIVKEQKRNPDIDKMATVSNIRYNDSSMFVYMTFTTWREAKVFKFFVRKFESG